MRHVGRAIVLLVAVLAFACGGNGNQTPAHPVDRTDEADDTNSTLDIAAVRQDHRISDGTRFVTFTLVATEPFSNDRLQFVEGEYHAVAAGVSTDDHPKFERLIVVDVSDDAEAPSGFTPFATIWSREGGDSRWQPQGSFLGFARVWRPAPDSIALEVPTRTLGVEDRTFRWQMRAVSSPERGHVSFDYAPEAGPARGHTRS